MVLVQRTCLGVRRNLHADDFAKSRIKKAPHILLVHHAHFVSENGSVRRVKSQRICVLVAVLEIEIKIESKSIHGASSLRLPVSKWRTFRRYIDLGRYALLLCSRDLASSIKFRCKIVLACHNSAPCALEQQMITHCDD